MDETPRDERLGLLLRLAEVHDVATRRLDAALERAHGVRLSEYRLLRALADRPTGQRRVEVAARVGMTASGVTRALRPLEDLDLVGRAEDPRDARASLAVLTPRGESALPAMAATVAAAAHALLPPDRWSGSHLAALAALLDRVVLADG